MNSECKTYPSDVTDEEWVLVAPYLTLLSEDAGQREHSLREVFNGLRYIVKTGAPWRWMPNDLPPWSAVYQQTQRWLAAGCFEALAHDLRAVLRQASGRSPEPSAAILDSRTLRSSPESGERAGYDGAKRKKGSKLHVAVDTLGHVLALHVTSANTDDRAEVSRLVDAAQEASQGNLEVAFADQGYTGEKAEAAASEQGVELVYRDSQLGVMGFLEILKHVPRHFLLLRQLRAMMDRDDEDLDMNCGGSATYDLAAGEDDDQKGGKGRKKRKRVPQKD